MDSSVNFPGLGQMFGEQSAMPGFFGAQQFQQAMAQAKQNQDMQSQEMRLKQQMQPLDMLLKRAQADHYKAQNGLIGEQTRGVGFTNDLNAATKPQQQEALMAKFAKEKSADELARAESIINSALLDSNINPESRKKLLELSMFIKSTREHQLTLASQRETSESVARINNQGALERTNVTANAGIERAKIAAEARNKKAVGMYDAAMAGKMDYGRAAVALEMAMEMEEDPVKKEELRRRKDEMEIRDQKAKQAAGQGRTEVDTTKLPPGTPLKPGSLPGPTGQTAPTGPKTSYTLQELQARYPGVDEATIRNAAKAKGITIK